MDSALEIVIRNLIGLFYKLYNHELKTYAGVYLVLRELCWNSKRYLDTHLMPIQAKNLFTIVVLVPAPNNKKPPDMFHLLPNGKRNGVYEQFLITGARETGLYLSGELLMSASYHTYKNGNKIVCMDDGAEDSHAIIYETDDTRIVLDSKPYIWIIIGGTFREGANSVGTNGIRIMEVSKRSVYTLWIQYGNDHGNLRVKYKYRQSHIYNLRSNRNFMNLVSQLPELEGEEFYNKLVEIEKITGWTLYHGVSIRDKNRRVFHVKD